MKKIIICGIPMKENVDEVVYVSEDKSIPAANRPIRYPVNAFLEETLKPSDLKELRQNLGLTQNQLAEQVGSSKNTISSIETGQFCPTAYLAYLLCRTLNCKFEELFYLD